MPRQSIVKKPLLANPAPLGLTGFGMTTVLLNLINARLVPSNGIVVILAVGIFYGGFAQIIAGLLEFRNGNTFGTVAFLSYGFFWLSLVGLLVFPVLGIAAAAEATAMGAYLVMWGLFTLYMFVGSLKLSRSLQVVFGSLVVLFFLLAIGEFAHSALITTIAGFEGIFCGASSFYAAAAQVVNEVHKRAVLPL